MTLRLICLFLFSISILGCSTRTTVATDIENQESELLDLLLKQTDFGKEITWRQEIVAQKSNDEIKGNNFEVAYVILNGAIDENEPVYVLHALYCSSEINGFEEIENIHIDEMMKLNDFGLESKFSCQVVPGIDSSVISECTFLVRYPSLISKVVARTEGDDYTIPKSLGDSLVLLLDSRVDSNTSCGKSMN